MESQQIPGDFQEMSCMEAQPPLGNKFCCLAFLLPDCDTSGQKERTELDQSVPRPGLTKDCKPGPLPFPGCCQHGRPISGRGLLDGPEARAVKQRRVQVGHPGKDL